MCQLMYMHYSIYHLLLFHVVRKLATRLGSRSLSLSAAAAPGGQRALSEVMCASPHLGSLARERCSTETRVTRVRGPPPESRPARVR